jgi:hypothetical protein
MAGMERQAISRAVKKARNGSKGDVTSKDKSIKIVLSNTPIRQCKNNNALLPIQKF